jgi:hypothetical protein
MAHKTKDGKQSFTNKSMASQYDRRNAAPGPQSAPSTDGMDPMRDPDQQNDGAPEMTQDSMDAPDGNQMMEEHGPAHKVTVQSDEQSGMHTVHAEHADGHSHMTQHGSAGAAHAFAGDCMGCGKGATS